MLSADFDVIVCTWLSITVCLLTQLRMLNRFLFRRLFSPGSINRLAFANMENIGSDKESYKGPQTRSRCKLHNTPVAGCSSKPTQESINKRQNSDLEESAMAYIVGHDKEKKEFYITLKDDNTVRNQKAVLQYDLIRPKFVDLYHTGVPPAFRGRGIAKLLAEAATEHFANEEIMMKPSCTYIQKYLLETRIPRIWDLINWDDID